MNSDYRSGIVLPSNRNRKRLQNNKLFSLLTYSALFLIMFLLVFRQFWHDGFSFVWCLDGKDQMHPWMVATGNWVRKIADNLSNGHFSIPMYDLSMGWGDDIIGYLSSSGQLEPFTVLFSSFVPIEHSEMLYNLLVPIRLYFAGLAFLHMCRYFKKELSFSLVGASVYLFGTYSLYYGLAFPYFTNAMIVLPLLIVSTEKLLSRESVFSFVISVFLGGLCGLYLMYMLSVIIAVYALVRFLAIYPRNERLHAFPGLLFRAVCLYCLGLGLTAPVLMPGIAEFFSAARSAEHRLFFSHDITAHLKAMVLRFLVLISPSRFKDYDWFIDFPEFPAVLLVLLAVLYAEKSRKNLKWLMGIALLTWACFLGGWIMNGFQYPCNRWLFGLFLVAGYLIADGFPSLWTMTKRQTYAVLIVFDAYLVVAVAYYYFEGELFVFGLVFLALTLVLLYLGNKAEGRFKKRFSAILLIFVLANVVINANIAIAPRFGMWRIGFFPAGYETRRVNESMEKRAAKLLKGDLSEGRVESTGFNYNDSMFFGIPGTAIYSSTENKNVINYWVEMEGSGNKQVFKTHSTDQRTIFNTLLSVKYQLENERNNAFVPFGYTVTGNIDDDICIFTNDYALPWGYTYEIAVPYEALAGLNGIEKQEAMLQAVALSSDTNASVSDLEFNVQQLSYIIECEDCRWENGWFSSDSTKATITLRASMPAGREYYVRIKGFDIDGFGDKYLTVTGASAFTISVECHDMTKTSLAESKEYPWYYGRENYLFCLGYSQQDRDTVVIHLPAEGKYKLEDIELYALPLDNYPERVEALRAEPLENIEITENRISGTVDLSKEKILCLTVPYSQGWTACVDGEKAEILKANYAFMGLKLSEGHHDIVFEYCSPGLKAGCLVFAFSLVILAILAACTRKKRWKT